MPRLLVIALLVVALAGCGGSSSDSATDFEGAEQQVAETIEDLEEAGQDDEPRTICSTLLSRELVQQIESRGDDCAAVIDRALSQTDTFALTVESVRVTGETARARVETGVDEEETEVVELVREGGAWKISGLPEAA